MGLGVSRTPGGTRYSTGQGKNLAVRTQLHMTEQSVNKDTAKCMLVPAGSLPRRRCSPLDQQQLGMQDFNVHLIQQQHDRQAKSPTWFCSSRICMCLPPKVSPD